MITGTRVMVWEWKGGNNKKTQNFSENDEVGKPPHLQQAREQVKTSAVWRI